MYPTAEVIAAPRTLSTKPQTLEAVGSKSGKYKAPSTVTKILRTLPVILHQQRSDSVGRGRKTEGHLRHR